MADGGGQTESIADVVEGADVPNPYVDTPSSDTRSDIPQVLIEAEQVAAAAHANVSLGPSKESLMKEMKDSHGNNLSGDEEGLLRLFMNEATIDDAEGIKGLPTSEVLQDIWARYRNLEKNVKFDDEGSRSSPVVILPLGDPTNAVIRLHHMLNYPTVLKSFNRIGLPITQIELNYLTGKKMTPEEKAQLARLQELRRVTINTANLEVFIYKT